MRREVFSKNFFAIRHISDFNPAILSFQKLLALRTQARTLHDRIRQQIHENLYHRLFSLHQVPRQPDSGAHRGGREKYG